MSNKAEANVRKTFPYKLIDLKVNKSDSRKTIIARTADSSIEISAEEFLEKDEFLQKFSPADLKIIFLFIAQRKQHAIQTIVAYDFSVDEQNPVLYIADKENEVVYKQTIEELTNNIKVLTNFTPLDAYRIGYFHGMHQGCLHQDPNQNSIVSVPRLLQCDPEDEEKKDPPYLDED